MVFACNNGVLSPTSAAQSEWRPLVAAGREESPKRWRYWLLLAASVIVAAGLFIIPGLASTPRSRARIRGSKLSSSVDSHTQGDGPRMQQGARGFNAAPQVHTKYTKAAWADRLISLPGLYDKDLSFQQFAGYLNISKSKRVFYWYVEAQTDPATAPLVFWTNGGPGCSGLYGVLVEHGPFTPDAQGKLYRNPNAWNTVANVLYVEIPVGVGFSYTTRPADYYTGDVQTALDNYVLIQRFLERFPYLRQRDFYLASESYGGHYMPTLAAQILKLNSEGELPKINLKGMAVGNPYTDPFENLIGTWDALWGHHLIPETLYVKWMDVCVKPNELRQFYTPVCLELQDSMWEALGDVNPYALSWGTCRTHQTADDSAKTPPLSRDQGQQLLQHTPLKVLSRRNLSRQTKGANGGYEACEADWAALYLNRPDVRAALRVKTNKTWVACEDDSVLHYQMTDEDAFVEPLYKMMVDAKALRILLYSGTNDAICSTRGTQLWVDSMKWRVTRPWTPYKVNGQTAGNITCFENGLVTFATVKGAGHEVPAYKPEAALYLISNFLQDTL